MHLLKKILISFQPAIYKGSSAWEKIFDLLFYIVEFSKVFV